MERAANISVVPFTRRWNDLFGWVAVTLEMGADASGNSLSGCATAINYRETLLRSEDNGVEVVGIWLDGIIAVVLKDSVLVADRSRSQDVKMAVEALKAKGARQA